MPAGQAQVAMGGANQSNGTNGSWLLDWVNEKSNKLTTMDLVGAVLLLNILGMPYGIFLLWQFIKALRTSLGHCLALMHLSITGIVSVVGDHARAPFDVGRSLLGGTWNAIVHILQWVWSAGEENADVVINGRAVEVGG